MGRTSVAIIAVAPGADAYGLVDLDGARRRCHFPATRWGAAATSAGWGAATVGARVAVAADARGGLIALATVGAGAPTYVYGGQP